MSIQELISQLNELEREYGNVEIYVDSTQYHTRLHDIASTEAYKFMNGDVVCRINITE